MKIHDVLLLCGTAFLVAGCAEPPFVPVNYAPSSALTASGRVSVQSFQYAPAMDGKVKPNQIRNTAPLGNIYLERNIDEFFREAVFKELRFVGVKVDSESRILDGVIQEFLARDFSFNTTWTLRVRYRVTDKASGKVVYDMVKVTERKTQKLDNFVPVLNETVKLNIEELLKDSEFLSAIKS